jgi:hypothetical protein
MTEPKKFKRGKHSYTRWGHNFKEVRIEGKKKEEIPAHPEPGNITLHVESTMEPGVYSNVSAAHQTTDEVMLDFGFIPPGQMKGWIRSRVIVPHKHVHELAKMLKQISDTLPAPQK